MKYDCQIIGDELLCSIIPNRDLSSPIFCFSGMAPLEPTNGGKLIKSIGSYTEVQLPDLASGKEYHVAVKYQAGFKPANRAWKPLGPYLRVGDEIIELPATKAGRCYTPQLGQCLLEGLRICPQPKTWEANKGVLLADGFMFEDSALSAVNKLAQRQGISFTGSVPVIIDESELGADAYEIEITPQGIKIIAFCLDNEKNNSSG